VNHDTSERRERKRRRVRVAVELCGPSRPLTLEHPRRSLGADACGRADLKQEDVLPVAVVRFPPVAKKGDRWACDEKGCDRLVGVLVIMTHHQRLLLKLWRAPRLHEVGAPLERCDDVGVRGRGCVCVCVSACDRVKQMCESVRELMQPSRDAMMWERSMQASGRARVRGFV
jgi:hypothetical protein